jgi:hypothetical protein
MKSEQGWFRTCANCGKQICFPCFDRYAWKVKNTSKFFCSYTCMVEGEEKIKQQQKEYQKAARERARKMRASRV